MNIEPIAFFRSPFTSKFGIPRQSGIVSELRGRIAFVPRYAQPEALRGLDQYDYLWLVWGFSENVEAEKHPTVRPPSPWELCGRGSAVHGTSLTDQRMIYQG